MLQNSTKQFHAFKKRAIFIQRILYIFNKKIILIQWIIYIFKERIILIQWIIYIFNETVTLIQRIIYIFNEIVIFIQQTIYVFNGQTIFIQNLRITNLVPKFSTYFLGSSRKLFHKNILLRRPNILLSKVSVIWYSDHTNFLKTDFVSQYTYEMSF